MRNLQQVWAFTGPGELVFDFNPGPAAFSARVWQHVQLLHCPFHPGAGAVPAPRHHPWGGQARGVGVIPVPFDGFKAGFLIRIRIQWPKGSVFGMRIRIQVLWKSISQLKEMYLNDFFWHQTKLLLFPIYHFFKSKSCNKKLYLKFQARTRKKLDSEQGADLDP